jgi:membrane protein DedA with SNARE-associated domain
VARSARTIFFVKNLTRGLLWLAVIVVGFILFKHYVDIESSEFLMSLGDNPGMVYLIYFISEIIVGIIPPEMFMMWSLELTTGRNYILDLVLLASISYAAGVATYLFGLYFHKTVLYRYLRRRYLGKFEIYAQQFGGFLIFVAAVTPIPYSGICMIMGAANYSRRNFFLISLFRFLRFAVYGYIIWRASLI